MNGRLQSIIGQPHQVISNIDHERALDWIGLDPLPILTQYLQPTIHVLPQQREALEIRV